jgi:hypothetical protein
VGKYVAGSKNALLGDGFKDRVLSLLLEAGEDARDFRTHLLDRGYSDRDANDMEQLEGDIFLPAYHVFLECKTSDKWRDSVVIKPRPLACFSGPHKFYVTSFCDNFEARSYVDIRVHTSKTVKNGAEARDGEFGPFCTFSTAVPCQTLAGFLESLRRAPK